VKKRSFIVVAVVGMVVGTIIYFQNKASKSKREDLVKAPPSASIPAMVKSPLQEFVDSRALSPRPLSRGDLSLAGIRIGTSTKKVRSKFGPPERITEEGSVPEKVWHYSGVDVIAVKGLIFGVDVLSAQWASPRGLKIGDHAEEALKLYGPPHRIARESFVYCLKLPESECPLNITFDSSMTVRGLSVSNPWE
jgi:hypothetical protein